jgi:hypothetical protein
MFDWEDPTRYEWLIRGAGITRDVMDTVGPLIAVGVIIPTLSFVGTSIAVFFGLWIVLLVVAATIGTERFGGDDRAAALFEFWTGIGLTVLLLVLTVYTISRMLRSTPKNKWGSESDLELLLTASIGIMAFVLGNLLAFGFKGSLTSFGQWLGFFMQEALAAASLDFTEVLDIHLSDIEPSTWYARLGKVFFKFLVSAGLVNYLWLSYRRHFFSESVTGSVKECFWECIGLLEGADTLELERVGRVEPFAQRERTVALAEFLEVMGDLHYKDEQKTAQKPRP